MTVHHNPATDQLTLHVDRSKIMSHGRPALGRFLLKLHMYRSTADAAGCRVFYEDLTGVEGQFEEWRKLVVKAKRPGWVFSQANTFLSENGEVRLREYDKTVEGVVRSWVERDV